MYYPYLRGRQFELIALREYAQVKGDNNNIIPIIEPVRTSFNSMKIALPTLTKNGVKFALIMNPTLGDFKTENSSSAFNLIFENLETELSDTSTWIPTFCISNNYNEINRLITDNNLQNIMLMCSETVDSTNSDFISLTQLNNIKTIISKENRSLKRAFKNLDFIRLDDKFNAQKRNIDYLPLSEEKFTEEHLFYKEDGFKGFSDFTPLNSDFTEGGSTPYSVAIHLTYKKSNGEVWIRHFASQRNSDNNSDIHGKFAEAAEKAVNFIKEVNLSTSAAQELVEYFEKAKYPGLGMIKKITIKNHLELMNN